MLKVRVSWLFTIAISLFLLTFPPTLISQEMEQEPNDPCSAAQIIGAVDLPAHVDGSLVYQDVDFFRFTAEPGAYLVASLLGYSGDLPPLDSNYLGLFDSNCELQAADEGFMEDFAKLVFNVPADGVFILGVSGWHDYDFSGSYAYGSYRLNIDLAPDPSAIRGRVVDAETGYGLPGDTEPYARVKLLECYTPDCLYPWEVSTQNTDTEGYFYFDSADSSETLDAGSYQLEVSAETYITNHSEWFYLQDAEELDIGDIALEPQMLGDSINGRLVDAVTGEPLPGTSSPYAYATLYFCLDGSSCNYLSMQTQTNADSEGIFRFESDDIGNGLMIGWYRVYAGADYYDRGDSGPFELTENEQEDLGDIALAPPPIIFSEVRPCANLPPNGGKCRYSVRVTSNMPTEVELGAWSIVKAYGIGSVYGWSQFQAGQVKTFELDTRENKLINFSFDVPETVQNGAYICPNIWVGLGEESAYFDTITHQSELFCITKDVNGSYSVLPRQAAKAVSHAHEVGQTRGLPAK